MPYMTPDELNALKTQFGPGPVTPQQAPGLSQAVPVPPQPASPIAQTVPPVGVVPPGVGQPQPDGTTTFSAPEVDQGFNEAALGDPAVGDKDDSKAVAESLAVQLREEFQEAEAAREMVNLRWLDDLKQYRGIYGEQVSERIRQTRGSEAFYRLTTAKVNTMTARLMDLLFPQRTKNWSIEATPDPMLPDEVMMDELMDDIMAKAKSKLDGQMQEYMGQGMMPDPATMQMLFDQAQANAFEELNTPENRVRVAKARAKRMEQVIDDQLKEGSANGQVRPSWRQNCRVVVKSACLYGMGVLKGPLIEEVDTKRYTAHRDEYGQMQWDEEVFATQYRPYHEAASIWEVYPDPGARIPAELRYVWQRHLKTDKDLRELFHIPGFRADVIEKYMKDHPDGDAELASWEEQVRQLNADNTSNSGTTRLAHRYTLLERWGYLTGQELYDAGVDIAEDSRSEVYPSCVWMLGDVIIKAALNPLEGIDIPFLFYPYQEDESSFWPEGIAYQLRTPQACINSAVRAMQDNAALSCGPIMGINVANLSDLETIDDMRAGKIFLFDRRDLKLGDAFQAVTVPSAIEHNLGLTTFWSNVADEVSTPRFNQGDGNVKGAGETASGLSMLMGASNILLKDHVKDFDDNIVSPFIRAMFKWNMKWNEREDIKGDFEVVASGSQSLIAKEVRAQQIPALVSYLQIPDFVPYIKSKELLEVALEQTDLPAERILRTEDEAKQYQQEMMQQQAEAQANAEVQALVQQLQKMGMPEEAIQAQLMQILGQTLAEGPQASMPGPGGQPAPAPSRGAAPGPMGTGDVPDAPPSPDEPHIRQLPIRAPE